MVRNYGLGSKRHRCSKRLQTFVLATMFWNLVGVQGYVPAISATNSARPMPMGAINVSLLFSAASIRTVKTSSHVRNISKKTPWATVMPGARVVSTTLIGPGIMQSTKAAATMPPRIWAGKRQRPRTAGRVPVTTIPSVTLQSLLVTSRPYASLLNFTYAGLKRPPLTR